MDKAVLKNTRFIAFSEGVSMLPAIHPGDGLYIRPIRFDLFKINDLIVFEEKDKLITHRAIYKTSKYVITKGDNNPVNDGKIYKNKIIGKVDKIKRQGKVFDLKHLYLIQSTTYFKEIIKLTSSLEKEKIQYVFLKGLPIHLYYQGVSPQRIYFDCDLMIDRSNFKKIQNLFTKFGYMEVSTSFNKKEYLPHDQKLEVSFSKTINGLPVIFDIHFKPVFLMTQINSLGALYSDKLVNKMGEIFLKTRVHKKINQFKLPLLDNNYQIFYLALHIFHHNYKGSFRYELLSQIIKKMNLKKEDWVKITGIINEYQAANFVSPCFKLLKKYFGIKVPDVFFETLNITNTTLTEKYGKTDIFSDESRLEGGVNRFLSIFKLSPYPFYKKILVFMQPSVQYFIFLSLKAKLSSFLASFR